MIFFKVKLLANIFSSYFQMNRHVGSEAISSFSLDCGAGFGWILKGSTPDIEGAALLTVTSGDHDQPSNNNGV
jgi:hypothetical protein